MISLLLAAVLVLATQNWLLGLLMFIVTAAAVVWVKRSDLMQERLLMRYLDDLSSGVSVGTVYAVRNLPLGIAVVDEKKKLVWANGVFRSWIAGTEEGTPLRDIIQGQKVAKLWGKAGWFDCHAGGTFSVYSINGFLLMSRTEHLSWCFTSWTGAMWRNL